MQKTMPFVMLVLLLTLKPAHAFFVDHIEATVNNDVILSSDIERFKKTVPLRKELDPIFSLSEKLYHGDLNKQEILEFLIQESQISEAFKVKSEDVEEEISTVKRNNNLSDEALVAFLNSKGFSRSDYFSIMKTGLEKKQLFDREIRTRVNISDEDVRNYFYNNTAKGKEQIPVDYSIQLIAVSIPSYKSPTYAQQTAENALLEIQKGEDFAEVAKRVSDHPSASAGGRLGFLPETDLDPSIRGAVQKLKIGSLSAIVKTTNQFVIVKLLDIRSSESQLFQEKKEQIREMLAKEEYKKQIYLWTERAKNSAYIHINSQI